ncbi:uncharacterized protein LOC117306953 isoform X2 [Asterias rubens]|uniref:uncharacterized protein LOC117306953 isoform X2 n=1 Tax=Asterias rubens TaxID=7604 RepID=UPI001454FAFC|nr:uncharacterized protein LOC117306953 isoform X2 [Asterias rubens]
MMARRGMAGLPNNMTLLCATSFVFFLMFQEISAGKNNYNLSGSSKCVRYGQQGQYAYRLYCDYCSIDHEKEDLPGPIKIVETSDCSATIERCTADALITTPTRTLKPVCGRGNKKKKWYCGFCSLQKERAVFKLTCPLSSNKPSCEDETQGPDGTATQAPDNTPDITPDKSPDNTPDNTPDSTPDSTPDKGSKDKKYRYVKQYCVASEEDVTFNDCGQKAPSFGVKMPEFLEKYKTEL